MQKHLFLTGPSGCGKSEAIRQALGPSLQHAGGIVTGTERDGSGALLRCSLLPAAAAGGAEGFTPLPYLDLSLTPPWHDSEVYRADGVRLLREAAWYPFCVLDGCGGFELLIPQYRAALTELLNSGQPLLGVLFSRKEAEALCARLGLSERVKLNIQRLWEALKADPDSMIVEAAGLTRRRALRCLDQWVQEYVR